MGHRGLMLVASVILAAAALLWWPAKSLDALHFVVESILEVAPLIGGGLLTAAWVAASGAGSISANFFRGRPATMIVLAAAIGTVSPVCGVTVLPLMAGFLAYGVPLAPIMAFWLSSPVTDPGLLAATWAVLGPTFAVGKTVAAFALGVFGGLGTAAFATTDMVSKPLRSIRHIESGSGAQNAGSGLVLRIWQDPARVRTFWSEFAWMTRLVAMFLALAFVAEYLLRDLVPPELVASYVGRESPYAIALAVTIGAPLYLDGYAALPLTRGLLDLGMSPGAAFAFLVAGSAASIWGVLAVVAILRFSTVVLFAALAVLGSFGAGYLFDWLWPLLP